MQGPLAEMIIARRGVEHQLLRQRWLLDFSPFSGYGWNSPFPPEGRVRRVRSVPPEPSSVRQDLMGSLGFGQSFAELSLTTVTPINAQ